MQLKLLKTIQRMNSIIVNLSGRGDKDLPTILNIYNILRLGGMNEEKILIEEKRKRLAGIYNKK